ncbi:hypothetical protein [Eupransor demetentiae]|uniref:Uncharacterized protein n=1 Tax=Eupransor demetentiae TaxID=3109584 RepID=A0ABM9N6H5_9LACO|nr:hypothetical protein R54876_GBNLAHCA_01129 [Lactobacillaceae bacterium LMG 33000]
MHKNTKVISITLGAVILGIVLIGWFRATPHSMTTEEQFQHSDWTLTTPSGDYISNVIFSRNKVRIAGKRYTYNFDSNYDQQKTSKDSTKKPQGTLSISTGKYAGSYIVEMDATDYDLVQDGQIKYILKAK